MHLYMVPLFKAVPPPGNSTTHPLIPSPLQPLGQQNPIGLGSQDQRPDSPAPSKLGFSKMWLTIRGVGVWATFWWISQFPPIGPFLVYPTGVDPQICHAQSVF